MPGLEIDWESGAAPRRRCGLLAVPLRAGVPPSEELEQLDEQSGGRLLREVRAHSIDPAKVGSVRVYQSHGELPANLIAVVGMGPMSGSNADSIESWRRLAGQAITTSRALRVRDVAISVGSAPADARSAACGAAVEGALLAAYQLVGFKSRRGEPAAERCVIVGASRSASTDERAERASVLARSTWFARDLINGPAALVTPSYLAAQARRMGREDDLKVRVHGPRELKRLGMGAILAVGGGSRNEPCLIELVYTPRRRGRRTGAATSGAHVTLVGKGITFDSGGLSLKPPHSMEIQKRDMSGGAAVMAAMKAIAHLAPSIEVRGLIAAAENMPGGGAYRPGDVLRTFTGKTVEVVNTDAEGRLVLADALGYAASGAGARRPPSWIVDLATLTGAVSTALGRGVAGVMGSDARLVQDIIVSGRDAGEPIWELPLVDDYVAAMDSPVADLKNTGDGTAGSIFGGLFLREFVGEVPWAHLDIAGVAFTEKPKPCVPRGAVGWGVRTLVGLVERAAAAVGKR